MPRLWHCQRWQAAKTYWIAPQAEGYCYTAVIVLECCPACGGQAMSFFHAESRGKRSPVIPIAPADFQRWTGIIRQCFLTSRSPYAKGFRETRFRIFVSDYTRRISGNMAKKPMSPDALGEER